MSTEIGEQPEGKRQVYEKWQKEMAASKKWFKSFQKRGEKANKAFLDEMRMGDDLAMAFVTRLNLFHSNIITLQSMLYGRIPKVEVGRLFADADDDVARVAGLMLSRMLNNDIAAAGEDLASVFRSCLQDRLIPGLGSARVQYHYTAEDKPPNPLEGMPDDDKTSAELKIIDEWTDIVYTHWCDILWSPCRTYPELRWKAYRSYLNKSRVKKRFKDVDLTKINFNSKGPLNKGKNNPDEIPEEAEAEIWEIWDKTDLCVHWYTEGYGQLLDTVEDPLELEGFWCDPPPMAANLTTAKYLPKSDYDMARSLYNEIDELESRITLLTEACKVVGVYDSANEGVQRIFNEGVENQLIPVKNWAQFAENGGLEGSIDWVPLEDIVNTISLLTQKQNDKIQQLFQVTGMNDVMRGAANKEGTPMSATQAKQEVSFGSIRIEALQNEFARWVSDTQSLKAEIIGKQYEPYCIIEQSNIMDTPDGENQQLIQAAVELIKDPKKSQWKITVRPESLAIADYAQLKQDRVEFIMAMAQFMQSAAPLVEQMPNAMPVLLKLFKWSMAGFKGSNEAEAILDQAISVMEKQPPQQKPDPEAKKAEMEMQKMQGEMQMSKQEAQANLQMQREKHQAEMQMMQAEHQLKIQQLQMELDFKKQELALKLQELNAQLQLKVQGQAAEAEATEREQAAQFAFNTAERQDQNRANKEDREHEAAVQMESGDEDLRRDKERAALKPKPNGGT